MSRSIFLLISAILTFVFGAMMFSLPSIAAQGLGIAFTPETGSVLRGMGGLIIGSGAINLFMWNSNDYRGIKAVLLTNIITHALGLSADVWGIVEGGLTVLKMAPVEMTHLIVGIGSLMYFLKLKKTSFNIVYKN